MPTRSTDRPGRQQTFHVWSLARWMWAAMRRLALALGSPRRRPRLGDETSAHVLRDVGLLDGRSRPRPSERDRRDF